MNATQLFYLHQKFYSIKLRVLITRADLIALPTEIFEALFESPKETQLKDGFLAKNFPTI